jgi:arginine-tRNA-protein transferase
MAIYDDSTPHRLGTLASELEKYFIETAGPCPYGLAQTAVYRQAMLGNFPAPILEIFFAAGYRRNGNWLYTMVCRNCRSCVPIRLTPADFTMNRNQSRIVKKNKDLKITANPIQVTAEKLALCDAFLRRRYPGLNNSATEYYSGFFLNTGNDTYEIEYRLAEKLIGNAVIDCGENFINAVYFYFDPAESRRSPGTFNVLHLINFCRQKSIRNLYLGYWIKEVRAMSYKANFRPHQLLQDGVWTDVGRGAKRHG